MMVIRKGGQKIGGPEDRLGVKRVWVRKEAGSDERLVRREAGQNRGWSE